MRRERARVTALRRPPRRRRLPIVLAVLGVLALLVGGGSYLLLGSELFVVKTVSVTGTSSVSATRVRDVAEVPLRAPLVRVDTDAIKHRVLAALPSLDTVTVRRSWPSTVRLAVVEREPVAVTERSGHYRLIDREGVPYRAVSKPPKGMVVLALAHPGPDDAATRAALEVLLALPDDLRDQVRTISAPTPQQVTLALTKDREVVWGGAQDSARKAKVLAAVLHRDGERYDISGGNVVTVR